MKSKLKLIIGNILILLFILLGLDFGSALILDIWQHRNKDKKVIKDERSTLENYKEFDWATRHFDEFHGVRSEYTSYAGWRNKPFLGQTINIDSNGYRKTIQSHETLKDSSSLIFLGGSTAFGTGVSDAYTIPSYLSKNNFEDYYIYNFGHSGYKAYQSYQLLQLHIIDNKIPEIVISYDGVNNSPMRSAYFAHNREKQIKSIMQGVDDDSRKKTFLTLGSLRTMIRKVKQKLSTNNDLNNDTNPQISPLRSEYAAKELLESWLSTFNLCDQYGIDFYCVLQPNTFVGNPDISQIENTRRYKRFQKIENMEGYEYYNNVFKLLDTKRYSILKSRFLDLTHSLDSVPDVYIDFAHLSPQGNEIIANKIVAGIEKLSYKNK